MRNFKIIIAGSRSFRNYRLLENIMDDVVKKAKLKSYEVEIISGTAYGADQLGEDYAEDNELIIHRFPADWNQFGKQAGFIRNKQMAKFCDAAVIFWDGKSKGTLNMIELMKYSKKPYLVFGFKGEVLNVNSK